MKRYGNLWPQITTFENLLQAARQAQQSKRYRPSVLAFNYDLEEELFRLQRELQEKTYTPGGYKTFVIRDPKSRLISAAPYRDRVVHHALCNVIIPLIDRTFIHDTYANRVGSMFCAQYSSVPELAGGNLSGVLRRVQTCSGDACEHPKIKPGQSAW